MVDAYKYDPEGVASVVTTLRGQINNYSDKINELNSLIQEIGASSSWKDLDVKGAFISTCESYVGIYNKLISAMIKYVNYLEGKAGSASALEQAFMR